MSSVKIINLTKSFNNTNVLKNITIDVEEGEFISLLGPSGCGKSTLLKLIAGLLEVDSGDIVFNNESVINILTEKRGAIIVFQDYLLFPHMTVYENIEFGLKMKKVTKDIRSKKVEEILNLVKLKEHKNRYPSQLSGGQQQRVAMARALVLNPRILLLDEPFSNLDINLRNEMREFVLSIQKRLNITTIMVTHNKEEALTMSNRVAVMLDGEIKQFDTPKNLYENPNSIEVANIFGERNYIKGCIEEGIFKSNIISFESNLKKDLKEVNIMIPKENISLYSMDYKEGIEGIIKRKRYAGEKTYYDIQVKDIVLKAISNNDIYKEQDKVKIVIKSKNTVYFR
ncbi:ABC transporter ATP-binding protein [Romboutsia maritimum]|uniref:ABC-type quaternary amine transporter n=1 Tax=Romboutsia maritimum TaxID=2020948 RepID=A0A371IT76_9FIRM|nr:ABC transporter ATP-binding protein [Romboutsia maritimum]RDY23696.1 ABC transporter ATP-binding protein [Romboutsia maritimum]